MPMLSKGALEGAFMDGERVSEGGIDDLYARLKRFAHQFKDCFSRKPTHGHLLTYMAGQHSSLQRKSIEPMALAANVPPRTLQEFLGLSRPCAKSIIGSAAERNPQPHTVEKQFAYCMQKALICTRSVNVLVNS